MTKNERPIGQLQGKSHALSRNTFHPSQAKDKAKSELLHIVPLLTGGSMKLKLFDPIEFVSSITSGVHQTYYLSTKLVTIPDPSNEATLSSPPLGIENSRIERLMSNGRAEASFPRNIHHCHCPWGLQRGAGYCPPAPIQQQFRLSHACDHYSYLAIRIKPFPGRLPNTASWQIWGYARWGGKWWKSPRRWCQHKTPRS